MKKLLLTLFASLCTAAGWAQDISGGSKANFPETTGEFYYTITRTQAITAGNPLNAVAYSNTNASQIWSFEPTGTTTELGSINYSKFYLRSQGQYMALLAPSTPGSNNATAAKVTSGMETTATQSFYIVHFTSSNATDWIITQNLGSESAPHFGGEGNCLSTAGAGDLRVWRGGTSAERHKITKVTSFPITTDANGYAAAYFDFGIELPAGLNACYAEAVDANTVMLKMVEPNASGKICIAPGKAVILKGKNSTAYTLKLISRSSDSFSNVQTTNKLAGTYFGGTVSDTHYVLSGGKFVKSTANVADNGVYYLPATGQEADELRIVVEGMPQDGKYYYISNCGENTIGMYAQNSSNKSGTLDKTDFAYIWTAVPCPTNDRPNGYKVYNIGTGKYLNYQDTMADNANTSTPVTINPLWGSVPLQAYIKATGGAIMTANTNGGNITGFSPESNVAANTTHAWTFVELTGDDVAAIADNLIANAARLDYGTGLGKIDQAKVEAKIAEVEADKSNMAKVLELRAMLDNPPYAPISVNITLDGSTTINRSYSGAADLSAFETVVNASFYAPANCFTANYTMESDGSCTVVVTTNSESLPFELSADAESAHWYAIGLHSNNSRFMVAKGAGQGINIIQSETQRFNDVNDNRLWAISGNVVTGFNLHNRAAGWDNVVTSADPTNDNSIHPQTNSDEGTAFCLYANTGRTNGFALGYEKTGKYLNANGNELSYWGTNDAGSCLWVVEPWEAFKSTNNVASTALLETVVAIEDENSGKIGYPTSASIEKAKSLQQRLNGDFTGTIDELQTYVNAIRTDAEGWLEIKKPQTNTFIRLKSKASSHFASFDDGMAQNAPAAVVDADGEGFVLANTIFYLDSENHLIGYSNGRYGGIGLQATNVGASSKSVYTFESSTQQSNNSGYPYMTVESSMGNWHWLTAGSNATDVSNAQYYSKSGSEWEIVEADVLPVQFKAAAKGYATLYTPVAIDMPEDGSVKAYTGTFGEDVIILESVTTVPAGTAVLLKAAAPAENTWINFNVNMDDESDAIAGSDNYFRGQAASFSKPATGVLTLGLNEGNIGFYNYGGNTLRGFSCYIDKNNVPAGGEVRGFVLSGDIETTIQTVLEAEASGVAYDLNGRRVQKAQNGIYVVNGKKIVVK